MGYGGSNFSWQRAGEVAALCLIFAMLGVWLGTTYWLTTNFYCEITGCQVDAYFTFVLNALTQNGVF